MASILTAQEIRYQAAHLKDSRTEGIVAGSSVLIAVATVSVVLRLWARKVRTASFPASAWAVDDLLVVIALLLAWAMFACVIYSARFGMGKHILSIGLANAQQAGEAAYIFEAIYPVCTNATKISILLLYRRIFTTQNPSFKWALYTTFALLVAWAITGFFTTVFQCAPVQEQWEKIIVGGRCINWTAALTALAVINTVLNVSILVLPIPMIWGLQMPLRRKLAIIGIFVIGCGDVVGGILRIVFTSQIPYTEIDLLWLTADAFFLSFLEPCLGIVCACLPVMRPLLSLAFGGVFKGFFTRDRSAPSRPSKASSGSSRTLRVPNVSANLSSTTASTRQGWREIKVQHPYAPRRAEKGVREPRLTGMEREVTWVIPLD